MIARTARRSARRRSAATPRPARFGVRARIVTLLAALAVLLGVGTGTVLALWQDAVEVSGRVPLGVVVFGAGAPSAPVFATTTTPIPGGSAGGVQHPFGPAQAADLYNGNAAAGGVVAIPLQVDSLAQGNRGLRYGLGLEVEGGVFGAAELETYKVGSQGACSTSLAGPEAVAHTPWDADYSAETTVTTDWWCVVARYWPTRWEHSNTVTVTAPSPVGGPAVTDSDSWSAEAEIEHDPDSEPTHHVDLDFETFGGTP